MGSHLLDAPHILLLEESSGEAELLCHAMLVPGHFVDSLSRTAQPWIDVRHSAANALNYLRAQAELAPRNLPVLIVIDLDLPKSTSLAFLRALRQDSGLRNLPVLAMAWSEEEAAVRSLYGLGVSAYVIKPVRFADLLSVAGQLCWKWLPDSSSPALCYQSRVAQQ